MTPAARCVPTWSTCAARTAWPTCAAAVLDEHGGIDVLVNNVGDYRPLVRFHDSDPTSWEAMYRVNLWHLFAVTQAFLASMIARGGGSIVNVHSVEGMRGFPGDPVYASMKAGVAHFTTSLAVGYGRAGIPRQRHRCRPHPDTAGRLPRRIRGARVAVGVLGPSRTGRVAGGPGPGRRCSSRRTCRRS